MLWTDPFTPLLAQFTRQAGFLPVGDLAVSESDLVLTLDLPGLTPEDVVIEVQGGELTVRGERTRPQVDDGASYVYAQRPFGAFAHHVALPQGVEPERITASMHNGVLTLIVPKPEAIKPKTIAIGATKEDRQLQSATA